MTYNKSEIMSKAWASARTRFAQLSEPSSLNNWGARKPNLRALFVEALRNQWDWAKWNASETKKALDAMEQDAKIIKLRALIACEEAKERFVDYEYISAIKNQIAFRQKELGA